MLLALKSFWFVTHFEHFGHFEVGRLRLIQYFIWLLIALLQLIHPVVAFHVVGVLETYRTCTGRYTYLIMPTSLKRRCGSHPRLLLHHVRVFCRLTRLFRFPNCQSASLPKDADTHTLTHSQADGESRDLSERNHPKSQPQPFNGLLLFCLLLDAGAFYGESKKTERKLERAASGEGMG